MSTAPKMLTCLNCSKVWTPPNQTRMCHVTNQPHVWEDGINFDRCPTCRLFHAVGACRMNPDQTNPKDLAGASKPQMGLVPFSVAVARVFELGAKKYRPYNWRTKAVRKMVYIHAALRHIASWIVGDSIDAESGQSHLAHAVACLLIILDGEVFGNAIDDREWVRKPKHEDTPVA